MRVSTTARVWAYTLVGNYDAGITANDNPGADGPTIIRRSDGAVMTGVGVLLNSEMVSSPYTYITWQGTPTWT